MVDLRKMAAVKWESQSTIRSRRFEPRVNEFFHFRGDDMTG